MSRQLTLALGLLGMALLLGIPAHAQTNEPAPPAANEPAAPATADHPATAHEAEGEGHEGGGGNLLELRLPLAVSTVIVFIGVLLVLWRFAWGPLSKALDEREHHQEETLRQAEHARSESERMLAEHRALIAQANDQVRAILEEARRDADHTANEILQKARDEAESAKQRAERDIVQARDQALSEIWTRTADLAVNVAGKVLSREIGPDEQRRLAEAAISELPAMPNGQEGQLT